MPKVRVDLYELDLDTLAIIEEAGHAKTLSIAQMRALVSGFLVDDTGEPLGREEAIAAAGRFKLREVRAVMDQIGEAFGAVQAEAVPKVPSNP